MSSNGFMLWVLVVYNINSVNVYSNIMISNGFSGAMSVGKKYHQLYSTNGNGAMSSNGFMP